MKLKVFIFTLLACFTFTFVYEQPREALAADIPNKSTLGKVVRAVGEKMGIAWTAASLGATLDYLTTKSNLLPSWELYGTIPDTKPVDGNVDLGEFLISPVDFNKTARAIKNTFDNVQPGVSYPYYCSKPLTNMDSQLNYTGYSKVMITQSPTNSNYFVMLAVQPTTTLTWNLNSSNNSLYFYSTSSSNVSGHLYVSTSGLMGFGDYSNVYLSTSNSYATPFNVIVYNGEASQCTQKATTDSVINNSNIVNTTSWTNIDNSVVNYYDTPSVPLRINVNSSDATVSTDIQWNDTLSEVNINLIYAADTKSDPTEPTEKPTGSSWWQWLFKPILDFIAGIGDFLLKWFVPTDGDITSQFNGISDSFKAKLPLSGQLNDFFTGVKNSSSGTGEIPTFKVTMPPDWGGGTFNIIDFKYFTDYRTWIMNFIRFTSWFVFLKRLYNKIANMVY